jgi:tetratricopeptide (TPR) repeat protein
MLKNKPRLNRTFTKDSDSRKEVLNEDRPRSKTFKISLVVVIILLLGIWLTPFGLALHQQIVGGKWLSQALQAIESADTLTTVCSPPILNNTIVNQVMLSRGHLEKSLAYNPNFSHTYLLLGRASCLLGDHETAVEYYLVYSEIRPENPLGHLELGFAYEAQCRARFGIDQFGFEPKGIDNHICPNTTWQSAMVEEWKAASITAQEFLDNGAQSREEKKYEDALGWYARAAAMGAALESEWWYTCFLSLKDIGDSLEAHKALEKAIDVDHGWYDLKTRGVAWYQWGVWLYLEGRNFEAENPLRKAADFLIDQANMQSTLSEAYRFLGLAQWAQDDLANAVLNLRYAVQINPQNPWAHIHYGKVLYLFDFDQILEVEENFNAALYLAPDNIDIWINIIDFWMWVGEEEQAQQLCQRALALIITDGQINSKCTR